MGTGEPLLVQIGSFGAVHVKEVSVLAYWINVWGYSAHGISWFCHLSMGFSLIVAPEEYQNPYFWANKMK